MTRAEKMVHIVRESLRAIILNDKTRYEHHQYRPSDGMKPREVGGGTIFLTPKEIAEGALRELDALASPPSTEERTACQHNRRHTYLLGLVSPENMACDDCGHLSSDAGSTWHPPLPDPAPAPSPLSGSTVSATAQRWEPATYPRQEPGCIGCETAAGWRAGGVRAECRTHGKPLEDPAPRQEQGRCGVCAGDPAAYRELVGDDCGECHGTGCRPAQADGGAT